MSYYDDFLPFKGLFKNSKKIEVFDDRGPAEKCRFWTFHTFADFAAKWVNYYILGVLMSYYDDFLPFKGLFKNSKKIEVFDDRGPAEKCRFWTFHTFADIAAKWVNYYIIGVLMSYYDDFLPFKGLFKNSKNLKFSMTADLQKNVVFGLFTLLQILQPNEWIITF